MSDTQLNRKAPEWAQALTPGHWARLSGSSPDIRPQAATTGNRYLMDGDPAADPLLNPARTPKEWLRRALGREPLSPWNGSNGFAAITECWNSAVFASEVGSAGSLVCFGGGHNDYFGSDVHAFDLATRAWSRCSDGYVSGRQSEYGAGAFYEGATYPDGSPLPPHTYDYLQYDPVGNEMLLFKGQLELGPEVKAVAIPHLFNFDDLRWRQGPRHPTAIFNSGGWTTWDGKRRRLWGHSGDDGGGNGLSWYSPDGTDSNGKRGHWGPLYPNKLPGTANHNSMQLDPNRDLIVVLDHTANRLHTLDPDEPARSLVPLSATGDTPRLQPYAALEYSARLDAFVYYSSLDGAAVRALQAPPVTDKKLLQAGAWCWRQLSDLTNSIDPTADAAANSRYCQHPEHVFGRFRVVDYADHTLALLIRHIDSPVYCLRLT